MKIISEKKEYENKIILIGGVPGTGKTTIAVELAKKLGIEHIIHTDTIRNIMRYYETNPLLHEVSHTAWKYFGECNNKNIIKGFFKHAFLLNKVIKDLIQDIIKKGSSAIIEGIHITPLLSFLISEDIPIFILHINNRNDHFKIFDNKNNKRSIKNKDW